MDILNSNAAAISQGLEQRSANLVNNLSKNLSKENNAARAEKTAKEFEAVFLAEMMNHMFSEEPDPNFGGGFTEQTWRGILTEEYGKAMSQSNNYGISSVVMKEIIKLQEGK